MGADGPTGHARVPVFVVTHAEPEDAPEGGDYTFVTDGIESALEQARAAAGDKAVAVMGGADIGQQCIRAGLVDEISIHLVPVLFGGTRMFEHLGGEHIRLEFTSVIQTPAATHLGFPSHSNGGYPKACLLLSRCLRSTPLFTQLRGGSILGGWRSSDLMPSGLLMYRQGLRGRTYIRKR